MQLCPNVRVASVRHANPGVLELHMEAVLQSAKNSAMFCYIIFIGLFIESQILYFQSKRKDIRI